MKKLSATFNKTQPHRRNVSPSPSPQHLRHHSSLFSGNFERRGEQGFSCDKLALLRPVSCNVLGRMMRNALAATPLQNIYPISIQNYFCGSKQWFSHYVQDAPNEERSLKRSHMTARQKLSTAPITSKHSSHHVTTSPPDTKMTISGRDQSRHVIYRRHIVCCATTKFVFHCGVGCLYELTKSVV